MSKITFIGLGVMGYPMAGHLAAAGHDVTVYNRTAAKAAAWVAEHKGKSAATPALADIFRFAPGSPVYDIFRRRSVDGRPVLVERIYIDPKMAPGLLDHPLDGSITRILGSAYDLTVARNRVDMRPCALVKQTADALGVKPGTPGLLVVRTSLAADGRIVEYDHEYWRHDAIRIHVDLKVAP